MHINAIKLEKKALFPLRQVVQSWVNITQGWCEI